MIKNINKRFITLCMLSALFLLSCVRSKAKKEDDTDPSDFDRTAMLTHYADQIIIPSYEKFDVKLDSMKSKCTAFTNDPTLSTLATFRTAWQEAYVEWQKVELFDFGPGFNQALRSYCNIYPTSVTKINTYIANSSSNLDVPDAYDGQGFPAFDYLLNGVAASDQEILDTYTTATDAAARRAFLTRLMNQMDAKFNLVFASWKGTYRDEFVSRASMDLNGSTSLMVNGFVLNLERYIRSGKFGYPAGAMLGGTPTPSLVEALYKKNISKTLALAAHQATIDFFNGKSVLTSTEGASLKTYLDAIDARDSETDDLLTEVINEQFTTTNATIGLLSENFFDEVTNNNQKMVDAFNDLQTEVRLLKVDMTSALSITITYTDNDGD